MAFGVDLIGYSLTPQVFHRDPTPLNMAAISSSVAKEGGKKREKKIAQCKKRGEKERLQ